MRRANFTLAAKRGSIQCLFMNIVWPCANYKLDLQIFPSKSAKSPMHLQTRVLAGEVGSDLNRFPEYGVFGN